MTARALRRNDGSSRLRRWPLSRASTMAGAFAALLVVALVGSVCIRQGWGPSRTAIPEFSLPSVTGSEPRLSSADLRQGVALLNVWATWCVGCRAEHSVLMDIRRAGEIPLYGLNYRDLRPKARRWLERLGNPYLRSGFDADGRVADRLGVAGAPETYLVDHRGRIVYRHVGPVTRASWQETLLPLVRAVSKASQNPTS